MEMFLWQSTLISEDEFQIKVHGNLVDLNDQVPDSVVSLQVIGNEYVI